MTEHPAVLIHKEVPWSIPSSAIMVCRYVDVNEVMRYLSRFVYTGILSYKKHFVNIIMKFFLIYFMLLSTVCVL